MPLYWLLCVGKMDWCGVLLGVLCDAVVFLGNCANRYFRLDLIIARSTIRGLPEWGTKVLVAEQLIARQALDNNFRGPIYGLRR